MKRLLLILCLGVASLCLSSHAAAQDGFPGRLEVEADPIAYLLQGYSLHVAYTYSDFRTSVGIFGIQQPAFALENKNFTIFSSGYDIKTDYLFKPIKGAFVGLQATYGKDKIGLKHEEKQDIWGGSIALRAGYRFMFGKDSNQYKGLYIVPWVSFGYSPDAETIHQGGQEYRQSSWIPFPTVHVGWRF